MSQDLPEAEYWEEIKQNRYSFLWDSGGERPQQDLSPYLQVRSPGDGWALEQDPQENGHTTKPQKIHEAFGQFFQEHNVILGVVLCRTRSWT